MKIERFIIEDSKQLLVLKEDWMKLQSGKDMTIFQSYHWNELLVEYWRSGKYNALFSYLVFYRIKDENNTTQVIIPLLVQKVGFSYKWIGRKRGLYLLGTGSYSDYLNLIYQELTKETFDFFLSYLKKEYRKMNLYLEYIRDRNSLFDILQSKSVTPYSKMISVYIEKMETPEKYTESLSKKTRHHLRNSANRIEKDNLDYRFAVMSHTSDEQLLESLLRIHLERLKIINSPQGLTLKKKISSFLWYRYQLYLELHNNIVISSMKNMKESCLVIVRINGEIAGYLYGLRDGNSIRILQNCCLEKFQYYSPMFQCHYRFIIQGYKDNSFSQYDLTRGNERYKYELGGQELILFSYKIRL